VILSLILPFLICESAVLRMRSLAALIFFVRRIVLLSNTDFHKSVSKHNSLESFSFLTQGNWKKSPRNITCIPPNGLSLFLIILAAISRQCRYSTDSMDTSSMMRVFVLRHLQ